MPQTMAAAFATGYKLLRVLRTDVTIATYQFTLILMPAATASGANVTVKTEIAASIAN